MYKPPQTRNTKTLREIAPPNISPLGACTWKITLRYKNKPLKKGRWKIQAPGLIFGILRHVTFRDK